MSKNFVDKTRVFVKGGDGGRGACSFAREKYVPLGGPDGGDGGRGGNVIFRADENLNTLLDFKRRAHFRAKPGGFGRSNNKNGANGQDLYVMVPVGTIVYDDAESRCIADLNTHGAEFVVAKGGRGGRGNTHFITAERRGPRDHELGEPGDERWLRLELRVVAQVGIIGFPNVGKSTLLSTVTNAEPAIADYPFTTLSPVLGVLERNYQRVVFADIPGLIEGAADGAGLGHDFLRHIDRTRVLLHMLDLGQVIPEEPLKNYLAIRKEIEQYSAELGHRPEIVAVNKTDLPDSADALASVEQAFAKLGKPLYKISCVSGSGLEELIKAVFVEVANSPDLPPRLIEPDVPAAPEDFTVSKEEGAWVVRGSRIEKAVAMTNLDEDESVARLQRRIVSWGIEDKLAEAGANPGDPVMIDGKEFSYDPAPVWLGNDIEDDEVEVRPSQKVRLENKKASRQSLATMAGMRGRGKRKR